MGTITKIRNLFPKTVIGFESAPVLYLADYSERTHNARKIEFCEQLPLLTNTQGKTADMDCLTIVNNNILPVGCAIYDDNQFKSWQNKDLKHCECNLFPYVEDDGQWCAFVEIKDCKPKNISEWKEIAKEQIIGTVSYFKNNQIVDSSKSIVGVISFPRWKTSYNDYILGNPIERKRLKRRTGITFYATNKVEVVSDTVLMSM